MPKSARENGIRDDKPPAALLLLVLILSKRTTGLLQGEKKVLPMFFVHPVVDIW